ncbi:MAG: hypothetical protein WAO35_23250 [Terriglobia bacterium]
MPKSNPQAKVLSVTYEITAQSNGHFSVPEDVAELLGAKGEDNLKFSVSRTSGEVVFEGVQPLKSGKEIMGPNIRSSIKPNERIRVHVSNPGIK